MIKMDVVAESKSTMPAMLYFIPFTLLPVLLSLR